MEFLGRTRSKPLCLWLPHKAVHPELTQYADGSISDPNAGEFVPAERHKHCSQTRECRVVPMLAKRPSGSLHSNEGSANLPPLGPDTGTNDETIRNRAAHARKPSKKASGEIRSVLERNRATRQHDIRLHQRRRLLFRRARTQHRTPTGIRGVDSHPIDHPLSEADPREQPHRRDGAGNRSCTHAPRIGGHEGGSTDERSVAGAAARETQEFPGVRRSSSSTSQTARWNGCSTWGIRQYEPTAGSTFSTRN